MSSYSIPALLQRLQQELYDHIYDLVFTADNTHFIEKNYQFPVQFRIDRASRQHFAKSYYGSGSTFTFSDHCRLQWIGAVPESWWEMVSDVTLLYTEYEIMRARSEDVLALGLDYRFLWQFEAMLERFSYTWVGTKCLAEDGDEIQLFEPNQKPDVIVVRRFMWKQECGDLSVRFTRVRKGTFE